MSPKHHGKLHNGIKSPSRDSRVSKSDRNRDKALVRHLELMHNFTSEAVKLLKKEEEENTTTEDEMRMDDSAKIFRDILTLHHKRQNHTFMQSSIGRKILRLEANNFDRNRKRKHFL